MILYTNLNPLSVTFLRLADILKSYNVTLKYGLITPEDEQRFIVTKTTPKEIDISTAQVLFWFAKTNKKLSFYRAKESAYQIYLGLQTLENHKDLIK